MLLFPQHKPNSFLPEQQRYQNQNTSSASTIATTITMPVTAYPAPHGADPLSPQAASETELHREISQPTEVTSTDGLFSKCCGDALESIAGKNNTSSFDAGFQNDQIIYSAENGFLQAVIKSYFEYLNLVIRPDDIRLAIITQLNLYIRGHAPDLQDRFVVRDNEFLQIEVGGQTDNKTNPLDFETFVQDSMLLHRYFLG
jgi:hypothetical protein